MSLLILLILAGALLGVYVGKLPQWLVYLATAVVLVYAIFVLRTHVQ